MKYLLIKNYAINEVLWQNTWHEKKLKGLNHISAFFVIA